MHVRWGLWIILVLLAGNGLVLHLRVHPLYPATAPNQTNPAVATPKAVAFKQPDPKAVAALAFSLIDLVLISLLFVFPNTAIYAYLLNGIFALYGIILMVHLSLHDLFLKQPPLGTWLLNSTLPGIFIEWADFFAGWALFHAYMLSELLNKRIR